MTLSKVDLNPFQKLKLWRDEHQVCSNLYCNGEDCPDCCKRICKTTTAKGRYFLTEKDISKLQFSEKRNPYYSSAPPMKLYRRRDIREIALKKYKSWTKIFNQEQIKEQKTIKYREHKNEKEEILKKREEYRLTVLSTMTTEQRKELITEKLKLYNLNWRKDSKLLPAFVKKPNITDDNVIALLLMTRDYFEEKENFVDSDNELNYADYLFHELRSRPNFELYSDRMKGKMKKYMLTHSDATWIDAYRNT